MHTITTQRDLRAAFWRDNPGANRRLIRDYAGTGRMHVTDTRVAWCDYVDAQARAGVISPELAERATLQATPRVFEYQVQGNYGHGHGWECETTEDNRRDALARLREYRANGPGQYRLRRCVVKGA